MQPKPLLEAATELVHRVLAFDQPADRVAADFFRSQHALGARDRHLLAESVFALLRRLAYFRHLAASGKGEPARRLAILAWQGNAGVLRAALDDAERAWLERAQAVDLGSLSDSLRHNLPAWLAEPLQAQLGPEFRPWAASIDAPAPLDLRVNVAKADREEVLGLLRAEGLEAEATPYSPVGIRVVGKPALQKLDLFTRGLVEVQDEGSQLLALLLDAKRGEMVVDFCAGAGGKTLAIGATMRNTGRLYAFDTSAHRLDALKPRLARSQLSNVHPAAIAHERDDRVKRLAGKIDRVLVDAPCSGLGTLRRNPDLKWRQSPQSVVEMTAKQAAILQSAARLVKSGGRLVYATCSVLPEENEAIAEAFNLANPDFAPMDVAEVLEGLKVEGAGGLCTGGEGGTRYLRLWPHKHATDGFFAAVWNRK